MHTPGRINKEIDHRSQAILKMRNKDMLNNQVSLISLILSEEARGTTSASGEDVVRVMASGEANFGITGECPRQMSWEVPTISLSTVYKIHVPTSTRYMYLLHLKFDLALENSLLLTLETRMT